MEPVLVIVIIVAVIAIGLVAGYFAWKAEKQRREALLALARELGWRFDASKDRRHDDEYAHFEIFRKGHSRCAYNTLQGVWSIDGREYPAKMGDFVYRVTQSNGKTTTTHTYRFSYLILHLPYPHVPDLLIRREGVLDKLAGMIGFDDIDFESSEFSRRFLVKSPDKRFAYDVIDPRMMEFLLQSDPPLIDIEHGRLCISDAKTRWKPHEFRDRLAFADAFFSRWPEHLVASLEGRA